MFPRRHERVNHSKGFKNGGYIWWKCDFSYLSITIDSDANNILCQNVGICSSSCKLFQVWDMRKNYSFYKNDPIPKYEIFHPGTSSHQVKYFCLFLLKKMFLIKFLVFYSHLRTGFFLPPWHETIGIFGQSWH